MKLKFLVLCVVVLVTITTTHAQKLPIGIGAKLGANLSGVNGPSLKGNFKVGYLVGAYADLNVGKSIAIQPELLFSQTSSTTANSPSGILNFQQAKKFNLHYMSIPILLDYKIIPFIHVQVGPQFSILLNKNESVVSSGIKSFKSGDFAAVIGAEARILKFRAGLRYIIGLSNVNDLTTQEKWKNQSVQIALSYNIL